MAIKLPSKTAKAAPAANSAKALIVIRDRIKSRNDKYQLETGRDLLDAKAILPHGQFGPWVKENFGWSTSTVNNFMNAAKLVDELPKMGDLKPSAIMALAAPSTPETVKSEVLADLDAGKKPTVTEVKAKIAVAKAPKPKTPKPVELQREKIAADAIGMLQVRLGNEDFNAFVALWGQARAEFTELLGEIADVAAEAA